MTKDTLAKLRKDLNSIKIKTFEKKRATSKKEKESIESDIQYLTKNMIEKYKLLEYDLGITMESHKTNFFIFDVEDIIRKEENIEEEE
ncbi:MAG: hypothetical protein CMH44_18995 [Muricauda sp.]|nr:hypothetical protein [Allomuricauda sp.]|tara:strand:- start:994 stop:1257 length:264 start_codon:yes stop_codon:yes gene_type:complete